MRNPFDYLRDKRALLDVIDVQNRIHDELVAAKLEADERAEMWRRTAQDATRQFAACRSYCTGIEAECETLAARVEDLLQKLAVHES